jgi:DNA-binding NarL/FixJ family response regulator
VRVVVATGDAEWLEQARAEGADGGLLKPVGVDAIRAEIGRVLASA